MSGKLVLCATPIGNLEDLSPRAARTLAEAKVLACEDTRRTRKLLSHIGSAAPELIVLNEATERRRTDQLVRRLIAGESIVLVSDAGVPGLSDPGFHLVRACSERGIEVEIVPGPNAAISALAISGLPPGRFSFEGFLPRKRSDRQRRLARLVEEERTLVFYESPHRIIEMLEDVLETLGDRRMAIARELTKLFEEVRRGTTSELLNGVRESPPKGEMVVIVAGDDGAGRSEPEPAQLAARARELMEAGMDRKDALHAVARDAGVSKRKVFDALLGERSED